MSAITAFNSRVRDAGDIERDSKLYGSFRSVNRFDLDDSRRNSIVKNGDVSSVNGGDYYRKKNSLHEDLFGGVATVSSLMSPLNANGISSLETPTTSNSSTDGSNSNKKRTKKSAEGSKRPPRPKAPGSASDTNEIAKSHSDHRVFSSSSSKHRHRQQQQQQQDGEMTNHNQTLPLDQQQDDQLLMESLRRRTSRRQRRQQQQQEKENQEPNDSDVLMNTSLNERATRDKSEQRHNKQQQQATMENKNMRLRSNSLIVKRAFEDPEKLSNNNEPGEIEVAAAVAVDNTSSLKRPSPPSSSLLRRVSQVQDPARAAANQQRAREYFTPLLRSSTLEFVLTPAPQIENIVHCKVVCHRGIFTDYSFYLDGILNKGRDMLVMKATRRVTSTKSYYLISVVNYNQSGTPFPESTPCARVISNMARNKFRLDLVNGLAEKMPASELLNVVFKSAEGEPTKIRASACLSSSPTPSEKKTGSGNQIDLPSNRDKITYFLKNRLPQFNENVGTYTLEYFGRAKKSSKHNFQIVDESRVQSCSESGGGINTPQDIIIQLGKQDTGVFSCDFTHPLCALQAFGFALSSLCR